MRFSLLLIGVALSGCLSFFFPEPSAPPHLSSPTQEATPPPSPPDLLFSRQRSWEWVLSQVQDEEGHPRYRIPGTEGNEEVAQLILQTLKKGGWEASFDPFVAPYGCTNLTMRNVVGVLRGRAPSSTFIVGAHFDTRPIADSDPDPSRRALPVLGANDGGSGTAVLLELSKILPGRIHNLTIVLVFFDGEDGGGWKGCTDWILGSTHHARSVDPRNVTGMILLDLVGSKDLRLPREGSSTRSLQDEIWRVGKELGYSSIFLDVPGPRILDDHTPYLERGIPAVDIIDLREPYVGPDGNETVFFPEHHTTKDDTNSMDPHSLEIVGRVVEKFLLEKDRG